MNSLQQEFNNCFYNENKKLSLYLLESEFKFYKNYSGKNKSISNKRDKLKYFRNNFTSLYLICATRKGLK